MSKYNKRSSDLTSIVEVGFQDYDVVTVVQDDSTFAVAPLNLSNFYPEFVRLYNDSKVSALIKINGKSAFTLPKGSAMQINFDDVTTVEVKSKETGKTTTVEVLVLGRTDLNV